MLKFFILKIGKFIYRISIKPIGVLIVSRYGVKIAVNTKDEGITPFLLLNIYENEEVGIFKRIIRKGDVCVDIGANIGIYSLVAAKIVEKKGHVFSFEPESSNLTLLRRNIKLNDFKDICSVIPMALSDSIKRVKFYTDDLNLGNHSLVKTNIPAEDAHSIDVQTVTLDYFCEKKMIKKIDIIKIDVQGAEESVIVGGKRVIESSKPKILMEFWPYGLQNNKTNPRAFLEYFVSLGYIVYLIEHGNLRIASADLVLEKSLERPDGKGYVNLLFTQSPLAG